MSTDPRENEQAMETPAPSGSDARARSDTPAPDPSPLAADESGDAGDGARMPPEQPEPLAGDDRAGDAQAANGRSAASSEPAGMNDGNLGGGNLGDGNDGNNDDDDDDDDMDEEPEATGPVEPLEEAEAEPPPEEMEFRWYILKVQVNREDSIREALQRRISRAGLDAYFGDIVVPTEDVVEFNKSGKKRTVKRKLYPGYIIVNMALTEETWFLVRETPGIGDFTGSAGKPTPMDPDEVRRIIKPKGEETEGVEEVRIAIPFNVGDRVRVKEGYFQNFEGDVESIDNANGRVTVMINIFGRSTPVELQHWQMERV